MIEWTPFNCEHQPEPGAICAIYSAKSNYVSYGIFTTAGQVWLEAGTGRLLSQKVTHYATINLPGEEEA
jgi:hypothetical protein